MKALLRTDPKQMEVQNEQYDERKRELRQYFVQSGLQGSWWAEVVECYCYL